MQSWTYTWHDGSEPHELRLIPVQATGDSPFPFGSGSGPVPVRLHNFALMETPVTQALWRHIMGTNPACHRDPRAPIENVSWNEITAPDGFIDRLNASPVLDAVAGADPSLRFRLPSETEWEYAACGGPHWRDGFTFSGSDNPDAVAWYGRRFSRGRRLLCRLLGWRLGWRLTGGGNRWKRTKIHPVATKAPNQIGLYDMSGNVWEWCADVCTDDLDAIPRDGSPFDGPGDERRLRGGCHRNWDLHCTASWRYGIAPDAHDGCIGFRLVLA